MDVWGGRGLVGGSGVRGGGGEVGSFVLGGQRDTKSTRELKLHEKAMRSAAAFQKQRVEQY